jgi:hypothetical protein
MNPHMIQVTVGSAISHMICNIRKVTLTASHIELQNNIALKATADSLESFAIIVMRAVLMREIRKCLKRQYIIFGHFFTLSLLKCSIYLACEVHRNRTNSG